MERSSAVGLAARDRGRRPCVVDGRLVFAELGLLTVTRLAREFDAWLPSRVRDVIVAPDFFLEQPGALRPEIYLRELRSLGGDEEDAETRGALRLWSRLPENDELASLRVFHLGSRADETRLPPTVDRGLRERAEQLAEGLQIRIDASGHDLPRGHHVSECFRDTLALAASLLPFRPFVLTRLERDAAGEPALCDYASTWGLQVDEVPDFGGRHSAELRASLECADLAPLAWAGVAYAVVQLVLPGFPVLGRRERGLAARDVAEIWSGARLFWHPVFEVPSPSDSDDTEDTAA